VKFYRFIDSLRLDNKARLCLFFNHRMTEHIYSDFNTKTEVVAVWLLFLMVGLLASVMHYFTVVRIPPAPIMAKLFNNVEVPVIVWEKLQGAFQWIKRRSNMYVGKLRNFNKEIEMKPLTENSAAETARGTSEDMATAIIGIPLEDDDEVTETKPQQSGSAVNNF
jgi:hypothetical protein